MKPKSIFNGGNLTGFDTVELYRLANSLLAGEGITVPMIADEAGTRSEKIYAYGNGDSSKFLRVVGAIVAQARLGQPLVLDRLAKESGYLIAELPKISNRADQEGLEAVARTLTANSRAVETFVKVIADGKVTTTERDALNASILKAEAALESLRAFAAELVVDDDEQPKKKSARHG